MLNVIRSILTHEILDHFQYETFTLFTGSQKRGKPILVSRKKGEKGFRLVYPALKSYLSDKDQYSIYRKLDQRSHFVSKDPSLKNCVFAAIHM